MRPLQAALFLASLVFAPGCSQSGTTSPAGGGDDGGGASDSSLARDSGQAAGDSGGADGTGAFGGDSGGADGTAASGGDSGQSDGAAGAGDGGGAGRDASQTCGSLPLCDDFESYTVGNAPGDVGGGWTLIGTKGCGGVGNPSAPTIYPIVVDNAQFHSGTKSAKVMGGDSCGPVMLNTSAFSKLSGGEVFGRFYVRLSDASATFDHTAFMTLGLAPDAGASLNVGDQSSYLQLASEGAGNPTNILMWQTSDSNVLPDKNTMGGAQSTYPMGSMWTCIEFHTSANSGAIEAWVNGASIAGLTFVPGSTAKIASVNDQWKAPSPFAPTSIGFGWILFSGPSMTLWFDDVALANSRIGCN
jgi:hypothetical protein